jgi:putative MATE family efflux protein
MLATAVMNVINVILNYLLIFGIAFFPKLGIMGAGIATFIARLSGVVIILGVIVIKDFGVKLNLKDIFTIDKVTLKKIFKIGVPSGLEQLAFKGGQLIIVRVIAILGTVAVATRQISLAIETFSTLPSYGLSIAATTLVGQKLGAKSMEEAERGSFIANRFGVLATAVMGLVFYFFSETLAGFYTDDPKLIQEAAFGLRILALAQPAKALNMILCGSFRGAGDTKFPMYLTFIGVWGLALPLTYLLGVQFSLGLAGIWWAMVADEWFRAIACMIRFKSDKWKIVEID